MLYVWMGRCDMNVRVLPRNQCTVVSVNGKSLDGEWERDRWWWQRHCSIMNRAWAQWNVRCVIVNRAFELRRFSLHWCSDGIIVTSDVPRQIQHFTWRFIILTNPELSWGSKTIHAVTLLGNMFLSRAELNPNSSCGRGTIGKTWSLGSGIGKQ